MITATELFNAKVMLGKLANDAEITDEKILAHLIQNDRASKEKQMMQDGVEYYRADKVTITNKKREYKIEGQTFTDHEASNTKLKNSFHKIIVDQKVGYIVGKPIKIDAKDTDDAEQDAFKKDTDEVLGEKFEDVMANYVRGASNKGQEFLHCFVNSEGEFDYLVISAIECIPIYDTRYEARINELIRYYNVEHITQDGKKETLVKAEWWTKDDVTFYIEVKESQNVPLTEMKFILDISEVMNGGNPRPHWIKYNTNDVEEGIDGEEIINNAEQGSWGRVPFVRLLNNDEALPDLNYYKALVDEYDFAQSDLADKIHDIADAIWKLTGYEGESAAEFRKNLKEFRVILLAEGGKADPDILEVPHQAAKALLDRLFDDIFLFAMAVNTKSERLGNAISGVALKFLYTMLDLKANVLIRKMKLALREFLFFVAYFIREISENAKDYDYKTLEFTFDKSIIINEQEKIQNLVISADIISEQTKTEEHPYAKENEQERKDQEAKANAEKFQMPQDEDNEPAPIEDEQQQQQ